jgi:ABC-type transport system substrate-binding protein
MGFKRLGFTFPIQSLLFSISCTIFTLGKSFPANAAFLSEEAALKADRSQSLTLSLSTYPKTLNPTLISTADENAIIGRGTVFDTLVAPDPESGEMVCWLCSEFQYDPKNRKVIRFKLKDNLKFHDQTPLTADDVKFSFDVALHPLVDNMNIKSTVAAALSGDNIVVLSPKELQFTFNEDKFDNIYVLENVPILPRHLFPYFKANPEKFNKDNRFGRSPLGSGPYKFVKWDAQKFIELERNDSWWGFQDPAFKGLFNFAKIRFKTITNDQVALQAFKKGDFDFQSLASFQYDTLTQDIAKDSASQKFKIDRLVPNFSSGFSWIALNMRLPIFADVKTRHALALLTDRRSTLEKFSKGLRPPTNGPWGINSPYQCTATKCPIIPYDPERANGLLKDAGWTDSDKDGCLDRTIQGEKQVLKFTILAGEGDYWSNVLNVYISAMRKAGVCASMKQLDWSASIKLVGERNFQAHFSGFQIGFPISPRGLFHSVSARATGSNHPGLQDPEIDSLILTYETTMDPKKREEILQQIHEKIYNQHIAIWHHESGGCFVGFKSELRGVVVSPFRGECTFWPRWYKEKT